MDAMISAIKVERSASATDAMAADASATAVEALTDPSAAAIRPRPGVPHLRRTPSPETSIAHRPAGG